MTEARPEYAAFISYNSADRDVARRLQRALESYSIPPALRGRTTSFGHIGERIGKVCRDRTDFKSGESLNAALVEALDKSSSLVVLCSPDSARSKWVNAEIEHFQKTGRAARIFPLIVRTDENRIVVNSFPPALRRTDGDEAIAADLQDIGDGWHDGVLKILASILDVEFDALRQRALEAARRRARLAYGIAGGMATLAVLAVSASVIAVRQRNLAINNFEDAMVVAAHSAERVNTVAEQTEVPRALVYQLLADTELDLESLTAMATLRSHPRARIITAEFHLILSDQFAEAGLTQDQLLSTFAATEVSRILQKDAANPVRRFFNALQFGDPNLEFYAAELEGKVSEAHGKALLSAGMLHRAESEFAHCDASRRKLEADWELDEKESSIVASGALSCVANRANVLAMLNRPGEAMRLLESEMKNADEALPAAPFARLVLAQLYADNGRLKESLTLLDSEIQSIGDATERQERIELAKLLETRAKALALTGRIADAAADLKLADETLSAFLARDSDDRRVLLVRGELLSTIGEIDAFAGERAKAQESFDAAADILTSLVDFDETRRDWRFARARLLLARADNALRIFESDRSDRGAINRSIASARAAIADIEKAKTKDDIIAARLGVVARVALARAQRLGGDPAGARQALDAAAANLTILAPEESEASPLQNLLTAVISDERGDLAVAVRDFATSRAEFERSIALQRAYLLEEPAAGLARRDLLWTTFASAQSLKAAGDAAGQRLRLQEACALARDAALSEYSLFARDFESLADVAGQNGVRC